MEIRKIPCWRVGDADDPLSSRKREINRLELDIARAVAPERFDVVPDVTSRLAVRMGITESQAATYCEIGLFLNEYRQVAELLAGGEFSQHHVRKLALDVVAVSEENQPAVEAALLDILTPTRPNQAIPSVRVIHRKVQNVVDALQPEARPTDSEEVPDDPTVRNSFSVDERPEDYSSIYLELPKLEALELTNMVANAANKLGCSRAVALMELLRGNTSADVTLNLYADIQSAAPRFFGAGNWLSRLASAEWLQRITHIALPGYAEAKGYTPTAPMRAAVQGRDGTCRFPGCPVPAEQCQLDHITRYDRENPANGGPTTTENLHCLCQRHHNLKTAGQWDVEMRPDGRQTWTSHGDGHVVETEPNGVLKRETFDHRAQRRIRVFAERNRARRQAVG